MRSVIVPPSRIVTPLTADHTGERGRLSAVTGDTHAEDREGLAERLLELVDVPSESLQEQALADHVRGLLPTALERHHDRDASLVVATPRRANIPLVLFAG